MGKIQRAGTDISLVAHSIGVGFAMDAADILAKEGISCEVVNLRSIRPLDMDTAFDVDDAVMESDFVLPIGKAKIQRAGTDISLVAHSIGVGFAMDAADILASTGWALRSQRASPRVPLSTTWT